jgi:hypothetical protein
MLRPFLSLTAVAVFAAAPAAAATYSAKPAIPASGRIATANVLWTCGSGSCVGSTDNSRPVVLCQGLAKEAGRIDSFTVDGREIAPDEMARCNASARQTSGQTLANAR